MNNGGAQSAKGKAQRSYDEGDESGLETDERLINEDRESYSVGYRRIEDIVAWKRARELAANIYRLTANPSFSRDYAFVDQIRRAAVSTMNNVAEGYERMSTNADMAHFLAIAKGSAGEVRSMLYLALDIGYIRELEFTALKKQADESIRVIVGYRKWALSRPPKGNGK